jgi:RNA polymerase sigma-70 factor (ECF subfamily)
MDHEGEGSCRPLEDYVEYLTLLARLQLNPRFRGQIDPADLVQQTLLKAHEKWGQFRGSGEAELAAWLRAILANYLADSIRKLDRGEGERECSLEVALEHSSARLNRWLAAEQSSPSQRAVRQEQLLSMAKALAQLPDDQRQALEMKHLQDLPVTEISRLMGRSPASVAGLLRRGLKALRGLLVDPQ